MNPLERLRGLSAGTCLGLPPDDARAILAVVEAAQDLLNLYREATYPRQAERLHEALEALAAPPPAPKPERKEGDG